MRIFSNTVDKLAKLSMLGKYVSRYQPRLIVGGICVTLSNLAATISPWVLKKAIDSLSHGVSRQGLFRLAILIVLFAIIEGIFLFLMRRIMIGVSRYLEYDLRNDFFAHLLGLSRRYYQQHKTGDIMSRATNDLNAVRMMLGPGIMYSANTIVRLAIVLFLMLKINVALTIFVLVSVPLVSLAVKYFGGLIHERFERIQEVFSEISARVQENLAGVRVIKAFTQEQHEIAQFKALNQEYIRKNLQLIRIWGLFYPMLGTLLGLGGVFVLWYGGRQVIAGRISLGDFVAFNAYLGMLTWPMIALGWVINIVERGSASMGRIQQILEASQEIIDESVRVQPESVPHPLLGHAPSEPEKVESTSPRVDVPTGWGIEIRNLTFGYTATPVLRDINLHVPAGSTFAIVGETGSGKSTLVNLLARFYEVTQGQILINGKRLQEYPLGELRSFLGYVPQESFLFSETIAENIAFGVEKVTADRVQESARLAHILPDILEFPKQFETMIGERGITLSGGQQQRTAIARALIRNPKILVLDDALSSVDTHTEEKILNSLKAVFQDRTSILISHRVSTVTFADQIVVLKDGRIAAQGRHDQLVKEGGYYAELYRKQLLEEELTQV